MHAKTVKIRAKFKQTKTNKQAKLSLTRQDVSQWSCHPVVGQRRNGAL
jgi:hypothetical protein